MSRPRNGAHAGLVGTKQHGLPVEHHARRRWSRAGAPSRRITASMVRLLPEPDSPTMPTASPGRDREIDAAHSLDDAAIDASRKPTRKALDC